MRRIYLDCHSLNPPLPEVIDGMHQIFKKGFASPAGFHSESKAARDAIDRSAESVLALIGASPDEFEVIFTGNSIEATRLAIFGFVKSNQRFGKGILSSSIESPAVRDSIEALRRKGFSEKTIPIDRQGYYKKDHADGLMGRQMILICLQLANAELGTIQNLKPIGTLARRHSIAFLIDLTAAVGRTPIHLQHLHADLAVISPSSFGGPVGVALLVKRRQIDLQHSFYQNKQKGGLWSGDENIPAIVGVGIAAERAHSQMDKWCRQLRHRQKQLWMSIQNRISGASLHGASLGSGRLCHQLSVAMDGVEAEALVLFADMKGLAISTSGGCLHRGNETDYVLNEIGISQIRSRQTIALGIGLETNEEDIEEASKILAEGAKRIRSISP